MMYAVRMLGFRKAGTVSARPDSPKLKLSHIFHVFHKTCEVNKQSINYAL
jgi:hypothetical protein